MHRKSPLVWDLIDSKTPATSAEGLGTFVESLLEAAPQARATLFDRPAVVRAAAQRMEASEHFSRIDFAAGDFFAAVPAGKSCYVLRTILHDWDDAHCHILLRHCVDAMTDGATLAVVESTLSERGAWAPLGTRMDLTMLLATQRGRQRTAAQMRKLLCGAGLEIDARHKLASPFDLWLCRRLRRLTISDRRTRPFR